MINLETFAFNALKMLQEDPRRYRNYGVYWYLVKAILKRFYGRDNLFLLGGYVDASVTDRVPPHASVDEAVQAAIRVYNLNAMFNAGSEKVTDPSGEEFVLADEDAGGL